MQLLDSLEKHLPDTTTEQLLTTLKDIASKVELQSDFSIHHPDYQPLNFPTEAVLRLQQMSPAIQNQFLSSQLCRFLYGIYYNAYLKPSLALDAASVSSNLSQNLENNTFLGIDLTFYDRLHASNSGEGYFEPGWQVLRRERDGHLAVKKNQLTLHIEPAKHLQLAEQSATIGDTVAILMPRNLVQNGFYMAVGNTGARNNTTPATHQQIVRFYFHVSSEGAVSLMENLTRELNSAEIPFAFKALYNPSDYIRYDCAVLYFEKSHYETVCSILQKVYLANQSHFHQEVPLFTKLIAPGLALAEEPNQTFSPQESFGINRCQIVANSLLEAWQTGDNSTEERMQAILRHFASLGIELQRPYLNANSEDIYQTWNF